MTKSEAPGLPSHIFARQSLASDPLRSVWVAANAGSGKTHILTQRVIRLLLTGVPPAKILCLTFTKAAAAQMATRVFETLARWTAHDDASLRHDIVATGAPNPSAHDLILARRLFTRAVETPGGLKIQTIHAFCERLLHLFPFEANVPARFDVADERRAEEMLSLAKRAALAEPEVSAAMAVVADIAGLGKLDSVIAQAMRLRLTARHAGPDRQKDLASQLGAGAFTSVAEVRAAILHDGFAPSEWSDAVAALGSGSANDRRLGTDLDEAAQRLRNGAPAAALAFYLNVFFTADGTPRVRFLTKDVARRYPDLSARLEAERDRLLPLKEALKTAETIERTDALVTVVDRIIARYEQAKIQQGVLDFDDLIDRTLALLGRSDSGWVLHKLDAGIDHILVDEAQDTSAAQWRILECLTGDFASGATARGPHRSFFVVGDEKQSIFSFQGAAPTMFDEMRSRFTQRFKAGGKAFERVALKTSFRSVPGILSAVDTVFTHAASHRDGLVPSHLEWPFHESIKSQLPGLVEIWPPIKASVTADTLDWHIPLDTPPENDPVNILADRVARKIKSLTAASSLDRVFDARGTVPRAISPGDILVLVRTRNAFFEAVIRALKRHYVPVAGADRLDVARHIAVMDLVAAGRCALLRDDDLSLACLLKSPLFGLTDEDLIGLAPHRRGALADALEASSVPSHLVAATTLRRWTARAAETTPFNFYVELLGRDEGRKRIESRLGPEAHDAIDEFLRLALAHEQEGAPSLRAFLDDVEALQSSVKRDMEAAGAAVRVMTVHAAKGLEAKIVFLPDTCAIPHATLEPDVFDLTGSTGETEGAFSDAATRPIIAWSPRKGDDPPQVAAAREAERRATFREYRRLLYVALTRAEERLYLSGFYNTKAPHEDSWSEMIARSFPDAAEVPAFWDPSETIRRIQSPGLEPSLKSAAPPSQGRLALVPDWLRTPAPAQTSRRRLTPATRAAAESKSDGLVYGDALHQLLDHLPRVSPAEREAAARAFLTARQALVPPALHETLIREALAVIDMPELADLFGPDARAEVPIIGRLGAGDGSEGEGRLVRGTVDRLVVTDRLVRLVDFKSGVPTDPLPPAYSRQMTLYLRVLAPLWPDHRLEAAIVWTKIPRLVVVPPLGLAEVGDTMPTPA
jgi:ATP-dependent helicase/nuclease subunit A